MTCIPAFDALRRSAEVGPYFALETEPSPQEPWLPFTDLLDDPAVVADRVDVVRAALAVRTRLPAPELDTRACASIHFLGLASRLLAPSLGAAALTGVVPAARPTDVRWQRVGGGPVPIAWTDATVHPAVDAQQAARLLHEHVIDPLLAPLVQAFGQVSATVLWGNVASAITGATSMLLRAGQPFALDPMALATQLLQRGPLAGSGTFDVPDRPFVRASCCLFYRIPDAGKCGDCVLR